MKRIKNKIKFIEVGKSSGIVFCPLAMDIYTLPRNVHPEGNFTPSISLRISCFFFFQLELIVLFFYIFFSEDDVPLCLMGSGCYHCWFTRDENTRIRKYTHTEMELHAWGEVVAGNASVSIRACGAFAGVGREKKWSKGKRKGMEPFDRNRSYWQMFPFFSYTYIQFYFFTSLDQTPLFCKKKIPKNDFYSYSFQRFIFFQENIQFFFFYDIFPFVSVM